MSDLRGYWDRFVNRADIYCIQGAGGRYQRLHAPLTWDILAGHLSGAHTLALDAVGTDGLTRWGVCDSDAADGLVVLASVQLVLAGWGLVTWLEASRRGGHLWLPCSTPQPAGAVRRLLHAALDDLGVTMEVYPNRDRPSQGAGVAQPVRLPLGVHQVTGQRYPFVDGTGHPLHPPDGGLPWLLAQARNVTHQMQTTLHQLGEPLSMPAPVTAVSSLAVGRHIPKRGGATWGCIHWVNQQPLPDLIAHTRSDVALIRVGAAYLGWCPFHDDAAPQADGTPGTPSLHVWCDPTYGWHWRCYSPNCGSHWGKAKDPFDWLVWCSGGSWRKALAWGEKLMEDFGDG
jgi:hypothetical protein